LRNAQGNQILIPTEVWRAVEAATHEDSRYDKTDKGYADDHQQGIIKANPVIESPHIW
jgi:hypothetical protein